MIAAALAAVVVLGLCPQAPHAQTLDPSRKITQYRLRVWSDEEGLPQNTVAAVLQLQDGTILAGTQEGLARFDGSRLGPPRSGALANVGPVWVNHLLQEADGTIWIATRGTGLLRVTDRAVTTFGTREGLRAESVETIYQHPDGNIWIGTSDAGLFRVNGTRVVAVPLPAAAGPAFVHAIAVNPRGQMLVGTRDGLFVGEPGQTARWRRLGRADGLASDHVYALTAAGTDTILIGTANGGLSVFTRAGIRPYRGWNSGSASVFAIKRDSLGTIWLGTNGGGLYRVRGEKTEALTTGNGFPSNLVWSLGSDDEGGLWVGTNGGGVVRLDDPPVSVFGAPEGLSSDVALATLYARDGTLWVGTAGGGLNAIRGGAVRNLTTADGLATNIVTALHEDATGALWVGTGPTGLHVLRAGRLSRVDLGSAFPGAGINSIRMDGSGRLWVGSNGAGLGVREGGQWRFMRAPESLPSNFVQAMAVDSAGTMFIATRGGVLAVDGTRLVRQPAFADPRRNVILALHASPSGSLWLGGSYSGISRLRGGRLVHIGPERGLPAQGINGILEDLRGTLWLTTNGGIFAVSRSKLEEVADGKRARVSSYAIGRAEGMRSRETNGGVDPPGDVGARGEISIPTLAGVVTVHADRIANAPAPRVTVVGLVVRDSLIPLLPNVRVPASARRMGIEFRVLSFAPPDALAVQYRLAGTDAEWVDAGVSRLAQYTRLPAGPQTFEVRARHRLGSWGPIQKVSFRRNPYWWERRAVYLLATFLLAAALLAMHRTRLRHWRGEAKRHKQSAEHKDVVLAAVTERETRFSALLEHASDAVFLLDAAGRISYVSPSMERLAGRSSEVLLGKALVDLIDPESRAAVAAALADITHLPRQPIPFRYRIEVPNLGWRTFSAIGRNLLDVEVVGGVIVNARDVTEQEEAENLFRQAQKVDAIGNLAGGIAHDFNNLLAVISANASMVKDDLAEMNVDVEGLDEITQAAAGGERLTRQLLSFSRQQAVNPAIVNLNEVIHETVPMLRALLGSAIAVVVEPSADGAPVYIDRGELEQVIVNLVVNAKGAMPQGGTVTLTVSRKHGLSGETEPGDVNRRGYALLSVRDTGSGMDAETRRRIFDPFFTTKRSGTGLGLATVAWIVKKAGGSIEVDSEPGKGSVFSVSLPVAGDSVPGARPTPELRLAGVTVLVVDDDEQVLKLATRVLRAAGAEVLAAESGEAALDIARAHQAGIAVLLTDLVMPGISGRELADRLLGLQPVSVLYMSGYTDTEISRTRAEGGDVGFLAKPFDPGSLVTAIEAALAGSGPRARAG